MGQHAKIKEGKNEGKQTMIFREKRVTKEIFTRKGVIGFENSGRMRFGQKKGSIKKCRVLGIPGKGSQRKEKGGLAACASKWKLGREISIRTSGMGHRETLLWRSGKNATEGIEEVTYK